MDQRYETYMHMLLEWNEKINLTAITDPEEIRIKHFADSLACLQSGYIHGGASVVDVGTGAGFPGIPIKLNAPGVRLTLMDSLNKRIGFLKEVTRALGIDADCIHIRAEDAGRSAAYRQRFDVAVSRAVASLPVLAEYCLPLVRRGGYMLAMKGKNADAEQAEAAPLIGLLGGRVREVQQYTLPGTDITHRIIVIEKTADTPACYPRSGKKAGTVKKCKKKLDF